MPQLILEYSANLEFDAHALLGRLHRELAATGAIKLNALKGRAVRQEQYYIGDGNPAYAFVHVLLWIRPGRPADVQAEFARRIMAVLKETFGARFETGYLSLSVDIHEFGPAALTEHNIPA